MKAVELEPELDHAWFYLGETRRLLGREATAREAYERCLKVNPDHGLKRPTTFQWEFTDPDLPAWHLTVNNGSSSVEQGEARKPDLRLRLSYQDWVDIVGERLDPVRAVATGRLRPRGNPLAFARLRRVFPRD